MQSDASAHEMARKLLVHSTLDHIFSAQYDVSRLPQLISQVGMQYIGCEFVSMWRYEAAEHILYNLVARTNLSAPQGSSASHEMPAGSLRLPVCRGPGRGIMMNLAQDVVDGRRFEDMPPAAYIVNDRRADERSTSLNIYDDASVIRSSMYAPLSYNGFKGMIVALNHERDAFTPSDFEILRILASKAAIVVDNIDQRKRVEETSRLALLGRAVDIVRHELKAPLTAINGAAAVIQKTLTKLQGSASDREMIVDMARMIASEVDRNVRMLREIQNYCKPRLEVTVVPGSLNAFLTSSLEPIVAAAGERRPELALDLEDEMPRIAFSREHLLEVLRNFVRNSAESGCRTVRIQTRTEPSVAVIEVRDDGGGIDDGVLDGLFRPYESRRGKEGGSGLGLFISRRIIEEAHGGRLSAHNLYDGERRVGLCMRIELPRLDGGEPAPRA